MNIANQIKKLSKKLMSKGGYTWIIDPGHGALNTVNRSPALDDGSIFYEWEFNRDIAERLMAKLEGEGISYVDLLPDFQDVGNFVMGRIARANAKMYSKTPIYVSIHSDAAPSRLRNKLGWANSISGSTVYYESANGAKLAQRFADRLADLFRNRGIKRRISDKTGKQYYAVLRETKMVAVLLEIGFYTNKRECGKLMDSNFRQEITNKLFETIKQINNEQPIS